MNTIGWRASFAALHLFVFLTVASGQIPIETHVLDNGLRVVLSEDHHAPTVSVAVAYDAGSRNEAEGETGLAHLIEHMMFRGSENVGSGEHYVLVAAAGSPPDARTTREATIYVQTVTRNHLDMVLFLEADRMRALRPTPESIAQERDRIRSEREAAANQPYGGIDAAVFRESFDSFGYGHTPLGRPGDLEGIGVEEVAAFHDAYYAPRNAVLAIVGDFDTEFVTAAVEDYFGTIPSRPLPPAASFVEPPRDAEARVSMVDRAAAYPRIDVAYRVPAGNSPQWYRLALLAEAFGGQGGRLHTLVEGGVAIDAVATVDEQRVGSLFRISAVLVPGQGVEQALDMLDSQLERLGSEPVSAAELAGARARLERLDAEALSTTGGLAESLALNVVYYGDAAMVNRLRTAFEGITAEHLQSVANLYLVDSARTVVTVRPGGSEP